MINLKPEVMESLKLLKIRVITQGKGNYIARHVEVLVQKNYARVYINCKGCYGYGFVTHVKTSVLKIRFKT